MSGIMEELDMILGVRVTNPEEFPKHPEHDYKTTFRTVVLNASTQYAELLSGPDPSRCHAIVIAMDAVAVLSDGQSTAQDPANTTTALPNPRGSLIPQNVMIPIPDPTQEVYVSTPLTGVNINRISVISVHKIKRH